MRTGRKSTRPLNCRVFNETTNHKTCSPPPPFNASRTRAVFNHSLLCTLRSTTYCCNPHPQLLRPAPALPDCSHSLAFGAVPTETDRSALNTAREPTPQEAPIFPRGRGVDRRGVWGRGGEHTILRAAPALGARISWPSPSIRAEQGTPPFGKRLHYRHHLAVTQPNCFCFAMCIPLLPATARSDDACLSDACLRGQRQGIR